MTCATDFIDTTSQVSCTDGASADGCTAACRKCQQSACEVASSARCSLSPLLARPGNLPHPGECPPSRCLHHMRARARVIRLCYHPSHPRCGRHPDLWDRLICAAYHLLHARHALIGKGEDIATKSRCRFLRRQAAVPDNGHTETRAGQRIGFPARLPATIASASDKGGVSAI